MKKSELFKHIIDYFEKEMPVAETELKYSDPYQLLVSVILSAQCTDKRVNETTPALFEKFPSAVEMSLSLPEDILPFIKSISYPNNKAKHLAGMAKMLVNDFNNIIPSDIAELQKLPGVGRKTANVILHNLFPCQESGNGRRSFSRDLHQDHLQFT
jgi:endonuclease-3